jgi:hypothetical protein
MRPVCGEAERSGELGWCSERGGDVDSGSVEEDSDMLPLPPAPFIAPA